MNGPLPPPLDQDVWDKAASDWAVASLDRIRDSADRWIGTVSTLLGLFATVVVIAGPGALTDVEPAALRIGVFVAFALAGCLAGAAIILGSLAAQTTTRVYDNWNGATFAAYVAENGTVAARRLSLSRWLGALAATLVLAAGLIGTWSTLAEDPATSTPVLVLFRDGTASCGSVAADGSVVGADGEPVAGARAVNVVEDC